MKTIMFYDAWRGKEVSMRGEPWNAHKQDPLASELLLRELAEKDIRGRMVVIQHAIWSTSISNKVSSKPRMVRTLGVFRLSRAFAEPHPDGLFCLSHTLHAFGSEENIGGSFVQIIPQTTIVIEETFWQKKLQMFSFLNPLTTERWQHET